jgi:malate dehydrogenase (oxaloacetate-decarboxylating)(NADP+)
MPDSTLSGEANLLVFPNLDAANIALGVVKSMTEALHVGPILLGAAMPAHILSPSVTSRGVVNMTTLAVVEAAQQMAPGNAAMLDWRSYTIRKTGQRLR